MFTGSVVDGVRSFFSKYGYNPKEVIKHERDYHGPVYYIQTNIPVNV